MTVRVAIPVRVARLRVWVDKGRQWSPVDQVVLWALAEQARTTRKLAEDACLPPRLVNEIILRMMRAGWVELAATPRGVSFRATPAGREAVNEFELLPVITRPVARRLSFIIEPFRLRAFSLRDIKPYRSIEIDNLVAEHDIRRVRVDTSWQGLTTFHLHDSADRILADIAGDEELSSIDFKGSTLTEEFALFTMIGKTIKGLPNDAPPELRQSIVNAAQTRRGAVVDVARVSKGTPNKTSGNRMPPLDRNDLVLTGPDHAQLFTNILRQARYRVIIHSTFLSAAAFEALRDEFHRAAKKGAQIDILWGASKNEETTRRNLNEAIAINHILQRDPILRARVRAQMHCTRSHAKLIVADTGRPDRYIAVVGSCNWLSAKFTRVETSIILRHPHAVAQLAQEFAELIFATVQTSDVAGDLNRLARELRKLPAEEGGSQVQILAGDRHGPLIRRARDTAQRRIVVAGDRLGLAAEARTIIPLISASERKVRGMICYSRPSGPVSRADAAALGREASAAGVEMIEIPDRELHGKFLLWDEDDVVISSLNWSSADTSSDFPQGEIGVYVSSPGLAADIVQRLTEAWPQLNRASA
jgi:phosphatidylserine/phosphatidylglycerophosphate/cardiolipin synthase-like enzyme